MLQTETSRRWARAAIAALGLTAGIVVIVVASGAPLSHSSPVNATSAQAPITALFVLLLGFGVMTLGALLVILWPRRSKSDDEPEYEHQRLEVPWFGKLLAILLPLALGGALIAAAVLGAKTNHRGPRLIGPIAPVRRTNVPVSPTGGRGTFTLPGWVPWTILAIVLVAVISGLVMLVVGRLWRGEESSEEVAARAAVDAAIEALDTTTDPRGAVIAAYAAMERTLAEHGVARSRAEAPREYLRRVLTTTSGAERDAGTLTELFEEARFSTHPISERVRELALSALSSLRARLRTEVAA